MFTSMSTTRVCEEASRSPIFVVGAPRSGTTLVAKILGRHSRLFMPGETHFFDDIYCRRKEIGPLDLPSSIDRALGRLLSLYERYAEPNDQERVETICSNANILQSLRDKSGNYKDMLSFFMDLQMKHEGKLRWGNNTPRDIYNIKDIMAFYPDAKIIVCCRDIRDFLLSYKNKWRIVDFKRLQRLRAIYHPVITSLLWKFSIKQTMKIKKMIPESNFLIMKYEFLVTAPLEAVKKLCEVVGERFEPAMLNIDYENSSFRIEAKGIYSESVGRWRNKLSPEEAYLAQLIACGEMRFMGYKPESLNVSFSKILGIWLTTLSALWRSAKATEGMRSSFISYSGKRLASLIRSG